MRILTVLERGLEERFTGLVGEGHEVRCARTWNAATRILRSEPIDAAVFDPGISGDPSSEEAERFKALFPSLPLMVYTGLSPALPAVMLRLGIVGVRRVILAWIDDHPARVGTLLLAESRQTVAAQLREIVSEMLAGCPRELILAADMIIREPASGHTVQHLAKMARMDRRTCARWLEKTSFGTPSTLMMVVRLVHGHHLLQDPGYSVEDVAKKLGYAQSRTFSQNVRQYFGVSTSEFRTAFSPDEVLSIVREQHLGSPGKHLSIVS